MIKTILYTVNKQSGKRGKIMKIVQKMVACICAVCFLSSFVGCSSAPSSAPSSTAAAVSSGAPEAAGETTLSVWCWSPNEDLLQTAAQLYNAAGKGTVKLDITVMALADVRTKLATITSSNDFSQLPDVILMQDSSIPMLVKSYGDAFTGLSAYGIDTAAFDQAKIAWDTYEGELYGIPFDSSVGVACYRTDYLAEAGYTIADMNDITWDEFRQIGTEVLAKTGHPLISVPNDSTLVSMMLMSAGGSLFQEDGTPNLNDNEKLNTVVELYASLVQSGAVKVVTNWDEYMSSLNAGTSAGTMNGMWIMNSCKDGTDQAGNWGVANLPAVPGIAGAGHYAASGGSSWMVTSNCADPAAAVDFLMSAMGGELSDSFYAQILEASNYIAAYLPTAGSADVYGREDAFFGNQKVFEILGSYVAKMPSCNTSAAYDETQDALMVAVTNVLNGADLQRELDAAQATVAFISG